MSDTYVHGRLCLVMQVLSMHVSLPVIVCYLH
jgi:hypothetical protein